jgi:hypothetical protein
MLLRRREDPLPQRPYLLLLLAGGSATAPPPWSPQSPTTTESPAAIGTSSTPERVLAASTWARVIKASDFTENAVGIIHITRPKLAKLAGKYGSLVPALRELILRRIPRRRPTSRT